MLGIALLPVSVPQAIGAPQNSVPPKDVKETAAFFETLVNNELAANHVPGAVVVLVKNGELFFSAGYGYADVAAKRRVNPGTTIFRLGSIAECVTATALMKLVEEGKLHLGDDVDRCLRSFRIDHSIPQPVRILDLLTHTGGLEEELIGTAARRASDVLPLRQYLAGHMPTRVFPPGDMISHSVQGYCLLGCVMEDITGIPFERCVEQSVFVPLCMSRSSFLPPETWRPDMAVGYETRGSSFRSLGEAYPNIGPAAGLYSTGSDIGHFMIAHIEGGSWHGARILRSDSIREMHRQQFTHHPYLPGMTVGFYESYYFNQRALYHVGSVCGCNSLLYLIPDERLGIFVANNGDRDDLNWAVADGFFRHYLPSNPSKIAPPDDFASRASRFTGSYQHVRHSRHTIEKVGILRSGQTYVSANEDGTLNIYRARFAEVEPLVFRRVDGFERAAFRQDRSGKITHLFFDQDAFEKIPWHQSNLVQQLLLWSFMIAFVSSFLGWSDSSPAWTLDRAPIPVSLQARWARYYLELVSGMNILSMAGLVVLFLTTSAGEMSFGLPRAVRVLLYVPMASSALAVGLPAISAVAWMKGLWSFGRRLHFSIVSAAAVGFIPWLSHWNLLGIR